MRLAEEDRLDAVDFRLVRVRAVTMRMRLSFCLTLPVGMTVPLRMPVVFPIFGCCRLRGRVLAEVMMVMSMGRRGDNRFRNAPLFPDLSLGRHLVVVFSASSLLVGHEPFERRLIHVAGERHLWVFHAQWSRVLWLFSNDWRLSVMMTIAARSDGKGRNRAWSFVATLWARFLLGRLTQ
jgi:hypothetical protein